MPVSVIVLVMAGANLISKRTWKNCAWSRHHAPLPELPALLEGLALAPLADQPVVRVEDPDVALCQVWWLPALRRLRRQAPLLGRLGLGLGMSVNRRRFHAANACVRVGKGARKRRSSGVPRPFFASPARLAAPGARPCARAWPARRSPQQAVRHGEGCGHRPLVNASASAVARVKKRPS